MGFIMLPNGCSWYETHRLGGCQRREHPRPECAASPQRSSEHHRLAVLVPYRSADARVHPADMFELCDRLSEHVSVDSFQLFVVNQVDDRPFNRGCLLYTSPSPRDS